MIARVAHADDKDAIETKIIGLYVPTRFKSTTKESNNDIPNRSPLPSIQLDHRDAPIGFYIANDDIKLIWYKEKQMHPTFFSYSSNSKGKESGTFFGVGGGFVISNYRLSRDFNYFNTKNWEFPDDAPKDQAGNLILFKEDEK